MIYFKTRYLYLTNVQLFLEKLIKNSYIFKYQHFGNNLPQAEHIGSLFRITWFHPSMESSCCALLFTEFNKAQKVLHWKEMLILVAMMWTDFILDEFLEWGFNVVCLIYACRISEFVLLWIILYLKRSQCFAVLTDSSIYFGQICIRTYSNLLSCTYPNKVLF